MSDNPVKSLPELISKDSINKIDQWILKYPADQKQSAVMAALTIIQEEQGYLKSPVLDAVAVYLDMPAIAVYEVLSFYTMYTAKPRGRHSINVCNSISCWLRGSTEIIDALEARLGIQVGETTADGRFTLGKAACLGACVHAPMMQVDTTYHENLTPETLDVVLEEYA